VQEAFLKDDQYNASGEPVPGQDFTMKGGESVNNRFSVFVFGKMIFPTNT